MINLLFFYGIMFVSLIIFLLSDTIARLIRLENKIDNLPQVTEKENKND